MTRIGLISDVHATPGPLREALQAFNKQGVETILCAGDIAGYGNNLRKTIDLLLEYNCQAVAGNHDLWYFERRDTETDGPIADYLKALPFSLALGLAETSIIMVHASPSDAVMGGIKLLDEYGVLIAEQRRAWSESLAEVPADIMVVGHTHQVFAEQLGHLLVINPGSTVFNHSCMILTLPEKSVEIVSLSGKGVVLSWNFSMFKDSDLGA